MPKSTKWFIVFLVFGFLIIAGIVVYLYMDAHPDHSDEIALLKRPDGQIGTSWISKDGSITFTIYENQPFKIKTANGDYVYCMGGSAAIGKLKTENTEIDIQVDFGHMIYDFYIYEYNPEEDSLTDDDDDDGIPNFISSDSQLLMSGTASYEDKAFTVTVEESTLFNSGEIIVFEKIENGE
ncbi:MAG: hypothetical protein J5756_04790 [Clostridia bacterium]|nr:hypothetical protein [Clostridia bacterium]